MFMKNYSDDFEFHGPDSWSFWARNFKWLELIVKGRSHFWPCNYISICTKSKRSCVSNTDIFLKAAISTVYMYIRTVSP